MRMDRKHTFRKTASSLFATALVAGLATGCGDEADDPEAITVDSLKGPGALTVTDLGGGKAKLEWSGSNNEDDFDGYNVYGMIDSDAELVKKQGTALELLDDSGEPIAASKTYLERFNWDPEKKFTEKGVSLDDGEVKFQALPIHTKEEGGDARYLPTCKPSATSTTCTATTADTAGTTEGVELNGLTSFEVEGLVVGSRYCFLVLSSVKEGEKVSQTSSNVACVTPRYEVEVTISTPLKGNKAYNKAFDLRAYLTACDTECTTPSSTVLTTDANDHLPNNDYQGSDAPLFIEQAPGFVTGKNAAIVFLGIHEDGFLSTDLPDAIPALTLDTNGLVNSNGYAMSGQTVPMQKNGVYGVAVSSAASDSNPTSFYYHAVWVTGDPPTATGVNNVATDVTDVTMKWRLAKNIDQRD